MFEVLAREMSKSIWKELGEEAAKKAVGAFIGEGIKAVFDVWKARQIKELDVEFKERQKKVDDAEKASLQPEKDNQPPDDPAQSTLNLVF